MREKKSCVIKSSADLPGMKSSIVRAGTVVYRLSESALSIPFVCSRRFGASPPWNLKLANIIFTLETVITHFLYFENGVPQSQISIV